MENKPLVGIIMGSDSDLGVMQRQLMSLRNLKYLTR